MALIGFEGFDNWNDTVSSTLYNHSAGNPLRWNVSSSSFSAGSLGGKKIVLTNDQQTTASFTAVASVIVGARMQWSNINTQKHFGLFRDSANAVQGGISIDSSGKLFVWRGAFFAPTVLGTGNISLIAGSDYFVEAKIGFSNSADVEVRLDGVTEISLSGVDTTNTANNDCGGFTFVDSSVTTSSWDDFYVCDLTGGEFDDFLGPIRVETVFVTGNDTVEWTPLASTNASNVDETAIDSDTTYNSSTVSGDVDLFDHGSISGEPATIFAVKVQAFARKEDVTSRTFRTKLDSGGTIADGTSRPCGTVYQMWDDYYTADPDTSAPWADATAVNNTKIGYENV